MAPYCPPIAHYAHVKVPSGTNMLYKIGKRGVNFKNLTSQLKVNYIWWNQAQDVVEIWGPESVMVTAQEGLTTYLKETVPV